MYKNGDSDFPHQWYNAYYLSIIGIAENYLAVNDNGKALISLNVWGEFSLGSVNSSGEAFQEIDAITSANVIVFEDLSGN